MRLWIKSGQFSKRRYIGRTRPLKAVKFRRPLRQGYSGTRGKGSFGNATGGLRCHFRALDVERRLLPLVPLAGVVGFGCKVPLSTIRLNAA